MAKQVITARLEPEKIEAVARLAEETGRTESDVVRRFVPGTPWPDVFLAAAYLDDDRDPLAVPALLMAEGLRSILDTTSKGIKRSYTNPIIAPYAIAQLFLEWEDGHATLTGVEGPLGNRFKLVKGPDGFLPEPNPEFDRWPPPEEMAEFTTQLSSGDPATRIEAGARLLRRVRKNTGPAVWETIGKAVAGDADAVAELGWIAAESRPGNRPKAEGGDS